MESIEPEWIEHTEPDGTPRSRAQHDYDSLIEAVRAGMGADRATGTSPLHEIVVTVTAAELEPRRGQGWTSGVLAGIPIPTIERFACTEKVSLLVTGPTGEPLHLSRSVRCFTAAQKKALTVAAGGRCQIPGCTTPAPYLDAHHVRWWERDAGPTHVGNGIMLCSYHHHLVHAKGTPIELIAYDDDIWVVPRGWRGPPRDEHRRQRGPFHDPRMTRPRQRPSAA